MDNVSHTLFALAAARGGLDRMGRWVTPTLLLAANLPDADTFGVLCGGKPWYLVHHRGLSHSAIGLASEIVLLALLVYAAGRIARRPVRFGPLFAASALGIASHFVLDALNPYGLRPWIPFDWTWYYGDVAFILDPWLWILFGGAACLSGPRRRNGDAAWLLFGLLSALFLFSAAPAYGLPIAVPAAWTAMAAAIGWLRARSIGLARPRTTLRVFLWLATFYLVGASLSSRSAGKLGIEDFRSQRVPDRILATSSIPTPGLPWRFDVVVETRLAIHRARVDALSGTTSEWTSIVRNLDDPVLDAPAVRESPEYEAWMRFARHRFVGTTEDGRLVLGDARYTMEAEPMWCNLVLPAPGP